MDVLIVDDSAGSRLLVERVLRKAEEGLGLCRHAATGEEALELLKGMSVQLILTDLNMDGMDGREFIQEVRSRPGLREIPIGVVTSEDDPELRAELANLGATFFLAKPMSPESIRDMFSRIPGNRPVVQV